MMSNLLDDFPYFNNLHTRTQALGLAALDTKIYYLSTAGPGTSCKSIWSSLISNHGHIDCDAWGYDLDGMADLQTEYQSLPNSNFQHMVSLHKGTNFLIAVNPQAAQFSNDLDIEQVEARKRLLEQAMPDLLARFVAYINTQTTVPLISAWAPTLWEVSLAAGGITTLTSFGDCLGAWVVNSEFDWLSCVQTLLQQERISFPLVC